MKTEPHALVNFHNDDGVGVITLNDPASGNSMTMALSEQLAELLEKAARDASIACLVIRGAGKCFCAGGNVKDMKQKSDLLHGTPLALHEKMRSHLQRITKAVVALEIPVIAAIQGPAVGAGCDLALMCDMRLGAESAVLAESFLRLGLVSGIGGAWFLTRLVGVSRAMELTLTSEFIDAKRALDYGLLSRVVPDADLDSEAMALARRIAGNPPKALRMAKRLVRECAQAGLSQALELSASMQAIMLSSDEHKTALHAFLDQANDRKTARAAHCAGTQ